MSPWMTVKIQNNLKIAHEAHFFLQPLLLSPFHCLSQSCPSYWFPSSSQEPYLCCAHITLSFHLLILDVFFLSHGLSSFTFAHTHIYIHTHTHISIHTEKYMHTDIIHKIHNTQTYISRFPITEKMWYLFFKVWILLLEIVIYPFFHFHVNGISFSLCLHKSWLTCISRF